MKEELHFLTKGNPNDPAVVCLHGMLGSARNLFRLIDAIAQTGFYVLAYDQRGHGHSPRAPKYTLDVLRDDVFRFLEARSISKAHLLGHSLGARVALAATAHQPGRILSLTMLDAGTRQTSGGINDVRSVVDPLPEFFATKEEAEPILSGFPLATKQFLLSNLRNVDGRFTWMFDIKGIRRDLLQGLGIDQTNDWKSVRCPALVVRGERSEYLTAAELQRMLELNPQARAVTVPRAGHWLHAENFADTSKTVTDFLKGVRQ